MTPTQIPDMPRLHFLKTSGLGYWTAAAINDTRPVSVKSYYDGKCHGGCSGGTLLDTICLINDFSDNSLKTLSSFAHTQEASVEPDLLGSVVQMRGVRGEVLHPQAKIYFQPVRREGVGIRRAASRIAALVKKEVGEEVARTVRQELLRRDEIYPAFYIAVAFRPDLEIETYHDVEDREKGRWSAGEVEDLVEEISKSESVARRSLQVSEVAEKHGFLCRHISCDLLGGDEAVSLFFDHPDWENATDEEYRKLLLEVCDLPGSLGKMPVDDRAFRISEEMCPIMIGIKISCAEGEKFLTIIEEIDPSLGDLI